MQMLVLNACVAVLRGWAAKIREAYPRLKPIRNYAGHEASMWLAMRHQVHKLYVRHLTLFKNTL
jgi:hypothetical protein